MDLNGNDRTSREQCRYLGKMKRNKLYFLLMFFFFFCPNTHWHGCTAFYFPIFSIIGNSFYFDIIWTINTPSNRKFSYITPNAVWFRSMLSCLQVCLHSSSSGLPPLFWHYRFPTNVKWNRQADRKPNSQAYNIKNIKSTNQFEHYVLYKTINKHHHPIDILNKTFAYLLVISIWPWCNNHTHNYKFFF